MDTKFAKVIANWAAQFNIELVEFHRLNDMENDIDGLIIITENQSIEKDCNDLRILFDKKQRPVQKIDINGTLNVGVSNFTFWLERNECKTILITGSDHIINNPNLERLLSNIKL